MNVVNGVVPVNNDVDKEGGSKILTELPSWKQCTR